MAPKLSIINLGQIADAITRQLFTPPPDQIRGLNLDAWPAVLQPVSPIGPKDAEPLGFNPYFGQNLNYTPRAEAEYKADDLRNLAAYPLARACISNVKDIICKMPLNIRLKRRAGESGKDYAKRKPDQGIIGAISDILENPNPDQNRPEFIRYLLEDLLVIDAASVLYRTTRKGELVELRAIDGATISRLIDDKGYTPQPPNPAYQQGYYNMPRVDLNTNQLLYAPRNIVPRGTPTSFLYGMSPTEEGAPELKIGIERLTSVLLYYTAGEIPDGIQIVPPGQGNTPGKIKETQDWQTSELAGNLARRRGLRLLQGFAESGKEQLFFPKDKVLADAFDEMHIRKVCFHYGTSPQRLMKMMNRASAQAGQEAAEKEGTEPWIDWLEQSIFNRIIRKLGFADYEATFEREQDIDAAKQAEIDKIYISVGNITENESREARGLDPRSEPEADQLMVVTATGPVPLHAEDHANREKTVGEAKQSVLPDVEPDAGRPGGRGKPPGRSVKFDKKKELRIEPGTLAPASHTAKSAIESALTRAFERQRAKARERVARIVKSLKIGKDDEPNKTPEEIAAELYASVEKEFAELPAHTAPALEEAIIAGLDKGIAEIEITDSKMISKLSQLARDWAAKRAAEMVGMKFDEDGDLVPNPHAKWNIAATTRDEIRDLVKQAFEEETKIEDLKAAIEKAIEDERAFGPARASMIARTEVVHAQVRGNFEAWKASGLVKSTRWVMSADHDIEDECDENAEKVVALGELYPSGVAAPPAHPNCRCALIAHEIAG